MAQNVNPRNGVGSGSRKNNDGTGTSSKDSHSVSKRSVFFGKNRC